MRIGDAAHGDGLLCAVLVVACRVAGIEIFLHGTVVGGRALAPTCLCDVLQLRLREFGGRGVVVAVVDDGDGAARTDGAVAVNVGLVRVGENGNADIVDELALHGCRTLRPQIRTDGQAALVICRCILGRCAIRHRVGIVYLGADDFCTLCKNFGPHTSDVPISVAAYGELGTVAQNGYALRLVVVAVETDGEDDFREFVEEVVVFPCHGGVGESCAEGGQRTRLSVQKEGHVVVDVAGIGDFGQCIVFVVTHQTARHVVARRAVCGVTVAGVDNVLCLFIPRAAYHRSHYLPHRRGKHIDCLVGSHIKREGHDVLVLHTVDSSNHVEAEQVRGLNVIVLLDVGNGYGDFHGHVLTGRIEHVACAILIVGPCQRESFEPRGLVKYAYVGSVLTVHGLEPDWLPAAGCPGTRSPVCG